ncbi:IS66 family insertion sequence element accessory protein TnpB [Sphingobacterium faecium]|uniref:IS66 family insertion sequence element accessory protein TnpB n=1 Tax=Sphingobacterium faecium TaxID=34087 RepID=UPI00247849FE|nr:IS66 family insertion sequence element accessory protein TnpB [Sphingobacterium faecium]WGQ12749.1 IS66 family insertion sequence element accessory protein TnpB [Sphingobacterium faecium]
MFSLGSSHNFYLYDNPCDMRKSFDGLCGLISSVMGRQATSGEVFVFLNRSRTHIKLLHWESGGFVLYYKRLEQGTFPVPKDPKQELSWSELVLMIEGIQVVKSIQKKRFYLP